MLSILLGAGIPELFPGLAKIILSLVPVPELHIFRSKGMRSDHTLRNDQFFSFLLSPNISRPFPLLVRLVTLFIPLFKLLREERMFYCYHKEVVAQGVGKGTQTKERRYVGRFGFCSLST